MVWNCRVLKAELLLVGVICSIFLSDKIFFFFSSIYFHGVFGLIFALPALRCWLMLNNNNNFYAPPRCRASQSRMTFIDLSVAPINVHGDSIFNGVGLTGFKSKASASLLA